MIRSYSLFLLVLVFIGCTPIENRTVFLGGQIINPSSSYANLYYGNRKVDTFHLKNSQRFFRQYDSLPPGVYKLEHIPEFTSLLIEPGDSLWLRFNTSDFQESLFFSGRGASKNNFLSDIRLTIEEENNFISSQYAQSADIFKSKIDSLVQHKKERWRFMDSMNGLTPLAQKLTQAAYVYAYAGIRERYALLRGSQWDSLQKQRFFGYRKYLNYGENDLAFFEPYISYLMNFLNREALQKGENYLAARQRTDYNLRRLQIIQNSVKGQLVRNNLARAVAYEELLNFGNHLNHDKFLEYYFDINTSSSYLEEITTLHEDINQMEKGKILPEILLQNTALELVSSNSFFSQPTVLYFWSQTQMNHFKSTLEKVRVLEKKHPQYRFVGISIQPLNPIALEVYKMMEMDLKDQYGLVDFGMSSKKWVITLLNKTIVIDSQGFIRNGFANMMEADFETEL